MGDRFIFWLLKQSFENFEICSNMHLSIKFMFKKPEFIYENEKKKKSFRFL